MKKGLILAIAMLFGAFQLSAQKVDYINTEKILSVMPEYKSAQTQLENLGNQYREKIEAEYSKIEVMYNNYQQVKGGLSSQARQQRENEIISREQTVKELQKSYFGQDGIMQKKSQELMDPIKARVDAAVKKIAENGDFMIIFDPSVMQGIAYSRPADDLSGLVIKALGY